jgi:hypothetical protein
MPSTLPVEPAEPPGHVGFLVLARHVEEAANHGQIFRELFRRLVPVEPAEPPGHVGLPVLARHVGEATDLGQIVIIIL